MNFRRPPSDEPEINLIPFIDVLLVIILFLMLSTTYSKFTELQVELPVANAEPLKERPAEIIVAVAADGRYQVDHEPVEGGNVDALTTALRSAAEQRKQPVVIISADATAAVQAVMNVLDAARRANLARITFATQHPGTAEAGKPRQ
jgi:biopolymer transport protein ExbD